MITLAEACPDLQAWLTVLSDLITEPDTQPSIGRTQPGSAFPGNAAVFNVATDIHAMVRELVANLRYQVTGTIDIRGGSDANTHACLELIPRLAEAVGKETAEAGARLINRHITIIMQLPAIDLEEPARKVPVDEKTCPDCARGMLLVRPRSGLTCCAGCGKKGCIRPGALSDGYIEWEDGTIT